MREPRLAESGKNFGLAESKRSEELIILVDFRDSLATLTRKLEEPEIKERRFYSRESIAAIKRRLCVL